MTILDILALLLGLAALFGFINHKLLRLPQTIGLVVVALLASGAAIVIDIYWPQIGIGETARGFMRGIDFHDVLLEGMLSGLLFASAVHVDFSRLKGNRFVIGLMATLGVVISTFFIGGALWLTALVLEFPLPLAWALVFGALISPTDPVAVLGMLKTVRVPPSLEAKIAGESLFNDGIAVVAFTIIVAFATGTGHAGGEISAPQVVLLFLAEALGGAALGLACGLVAFLLMRWAEEYSLEVMITLALATGTYAAALHLHVSGPIAALVAGLIIGNHGRRFAMSERTREHVFQFWELTDEILNAILFLLIGLEVLVIGFDRTHVLLALLAIPIVLVGRWTSVSVPLGLLSRRRTFTRGAVRILTWGGLRGGISVALALSLPVTEITSLILSATYAVVIFSIIVQGLTMRPLVRRLIAQEEAALLHEETPAAPPAPQEPEAEHKAAENGEPGLTGKPSDPSGKPSDEEKDKDSEPPRMTFELKPKPDALPSAAAKTDKGDEPPEPTGEARHALGRGSASSKPADGDDALDRAEEKETAMADTGGDGEAPKDKAPKDKAPGERS